MEWTRRLITILVVLHTLSVQSQESTVYHNESGAPWIHLSVDFRASSDANFDLLLNVENEEDYMRLRINYGDQPVLQLVRRQYGYDRLWQELKPAILWKTGEWYQLSIEKAPWIDLEDWRPWKIVITNKETKEVLLRQGIENEMPAFGMGKVGICTKKNTDFRHFQCVPIQRCYGQQALKLAPLFCDRMVLQQNKKISIWGQARPMACVKVFFQGKEYVTVANGQGDWTIAMDAFPAMEGQLLEVTSEGECVKVKDIAIGEVWLASGQSNMEMRSWQSDVSSIARLNTPDDGLRFFVQPQWPSDHAVFDSGGEWLKADSIHAMGVSAVAYSFAQRLRTELGIPVGIICSYWGGTAIESWMPQEKLLTDSLAEPIWKRYHHYQKALEQRLPIEASYPYSWDIPGQRHSPGYLFNGMMAPLIPYALKGILWYQGESNSERARQYETLFPMLLDSWRERWKEELPFYYVQLAGYDGKQSGSDIDQAWPHLRDAQRLLLTKRKQVGMVTAIDLGHPTDVHPATKAEIGNRLCRLALHDLYHHKEVIRCGPIYDTVSYREGKAFVYFGEIGDGLRVKENQDLQGFMIAGDNRIFYPAQAVIEKNGNCVILQSKQVADPVAVRYAWENDPKQANLMNSAGLPAASFRTDSWELPTDQNL